MLGPSLCCRQRATVDDDARANARPCLGFGVSIAREEKRKEKGTTVVRPWPRPVSIANPDPRTKAAVERRQRTGGRAWSAPGTGTGRRDWMGRETNGDGDGGGLDPLAELRADPLRWARSWSSYSTVSCSSTVVTVRSTPQPGLLPDWFMPVVTYGMPRYGTVHCTASALRCGTEGRSQDGCIWYKTYILSSTQPGRAAGSGLIIKGRKELGC